MGTCETGVLRCFDARHEASMWSEWLYTYMYSVCIREPAPVGMRQRVCAPGFAPVFGGRPGRDYMNQRKNVAGDTPQGQKQDL